MSRSTSKRQSKAEEQRAAAAMKARKEYYRERKARQQRNTLLMVLVPILLVVVAWIGLGVFRESYWEPRQPVARVSGTTITADDYGKRVQYARGQVLNSLNSFLGLISSSDASFIQQYAEGQRTGVAQNTLDEMIDEEIVIQEAESRGITVTDEEVQDRIREELAAVLEGPESVEEETADESDGDEGDAENADEGDGGDADADAEADEGDTDAAEDEGGDEDAESDADAGDDTDEDADADEGDIAYSDEELERVYESQLEPQLRNAGMTRADYEEIVRRQIYREKLNEALADELPTTAEQVEIAYLLFDDEAAAQEAVEAVNGGTAWSQVIARFEEPEEAPESEADAEGDEADAEGDEADAEGDEADAEGDEADAEGDEADAEGDEADAEGDEADAEGDEADAEGDEADAEGDEADAEGDEADAEGDEADAEPAYALEVGERRWFTRDALAERLGLTEGEVGTVFDVAPGEAAEPLTGTRGTYVIVVFEREDERELEESDLQALRDGALTAWLDTRRTELSTEIDRFPLEGITPAEPDWFVQGYQQLVGGISSEPSLQLDGQTAPVGGTGGDGDG